MNALGRHILADFHECDVAILNDVPKIEMIMNEAAEIAGATIVQSTFHHFSPHGVSGVVVIAESHLAVHTWPEHGYAAVDIFTCGDTLKPMKAYEFMQKALGAKKANWKEILRGAFSEQ